MNLMQAFNEAYKMLGYTNEDGVSDNAEDNQKLITIGNMVYIELQNPKEEVVRFKTMNDKILLDERVIYDCFLYGLAMWLALQLNDGDNNQIFSTLYEQKKKHLNKLTFIKDEFMR